MVVGKVSEFIGSLYYLCVTLLRFKNIMKLKNYLLLLALLLAVGVRAQVPTGDKYPKREFRAAWIQAVNGQFRGVPTERLKRFKGRVLMRLSFKCVPKRMRCMLRNMNRGAVF